MIEFLKQVQVWVIIILVVYLGLNLILFLGPILMVGIMFIMLSAIPLLVVLMSVILLVRLIKYIIK